MKNLYLLFLTILLAGFLNINAFAVGELEGIKLTKDGTGYVINFNLPDYSMENFKYEDENFLILNLPEYGITSEPGLPQLPQISFNMNIPYEENTASFQILNTQKETEVLSSKIFPFQEPWEKANPLDERPFTINRDYYNTTGNQFPFVEISESFVISGAKGVRVTIYPFSYNPKDNELTIIKSGAFRIEMNREVQIDRMHSSAYVNFLDNAFVNYNGVAERTGVNYLIITAPEFQTGLTDFVNYKTGKGYNVDVVNTGTTGTTTTSIKNFIQQRYDDPMLRPEFILLVGDVDKIPCWTGDGTGSPPTDLHYVMTEGADYFADIFIGRFSVTSPIELNNIIDKTIFMDNFIATLDKKNVFMASQDNYTISEGTHNYVIDTWFDPDGYTNLKLYSHTYNATTQQLIDALNDNQQFAIYSGHGSTTSWADGPPLNQSQVENLTNTVYPFVYSFACITGEFDYSECFGETWIRTDNGASSFYGSSVNSYWDEDDILERRIFDSMYEDDLTQVTPMFDMGKIKLVNHYGGFSGMMIRYVEMYNLMGDPSLGVKKQIDPDTTPPDPVTDLSINNPTSNSLTLNWTAPYDSTYGGVTTYDIRYSTTMINNDDDFNNAPQMIFDGQSDSAGTPKAFTLDNLDFGTTYYCAIKAMDMWGNASDMSNVESLSTYDAPVIAVTPDSLICPMLPNTTMTDSVIISNISAGNSTLDYSIELTNHTFPANVQLRLVALNQENPSENINRKDNTIIIHGSSIKGSGGPDAFGYEWIDSNEPNGPDYVWNDISSSGTMLTNWTPTGSFDALDEGYAGPVDIGFDFKFYGVEKSQIYVNTNGVLAFSPITDDIYSNDPIPDTDYPNEIIAPFWDDLDGRSQGAVYYLQEPNKFTIQFDEWQEYSGSGSLTFQIVLHKNGKIMYYYNNMNADLDACTVGIENTNGTVGLQVANNAVYVENELAVQISAEPDWLELTNLEGTIYNGNSVAVLLDMNCIDLEDGEYSMDMVVSSNDPDNPEKIIPVKMIVGEDVPVELASFNANVNENEVVLDWTTSTETNNRGFEIQKTPLSPPFIKGGKQGGSNGKWQKVGFVDGYGTTTEVQSYRFTDDNLQPGDYIYRLKQIDYDGTFSYSNEVEVTFMKPDNYELAQNYPNPFNPSTTIKYSLPFESKVKLVVYNLLGQKVIELVNKTQSTGYYEFNWNASDLSSGVYIYMLEAKSLEENDEFRSVKKLVLVK